MSRKIIFLVPVFALVLLTACVAGGVVMAQDTPDKTSAIKFSGSGTLDFTETTPCSHEECFSITGTVTKTSMPGLGTGDVSGDSWTDACKVNRAAKKKCCTFGSTQTFSFSDGNLDVTVGGTACGKEVTDVTVKGAKFEITGGTGLFAGASGSGKSTLTLNEDTGDATFNFSGKLKE